jgi:hypothetical protein
MARLIIALVATTCIPAPVYADPILTPLLVSAGVTGALTIGGATITYASILSYAIITAAALGAALLLQPNQGRRPEQNRDPGQLQVKQSVPPRVRGYGRAKLGGALAMMETAYGALYQAWVHCEGPIHAYEEWWLNDAKTGIVSGSLSGQAGIKPWFDKIEIESYLGTSTQTASPLLLGGFPGIWTVNHRLLGLAYSVMQLKPVVQNEFQRTYPNGPPALRVVARLLKVYDPRSGATAWSDNPALCIRDFLTDERGMGIPESRINEASFRAFADLCDELVPLKAGGTEKRYRIGGTFELTEEPREVLRRMLATCDGEIVPFPDGTIGIAGGRWTEPTVTIDDALILSYEAEQGSDKLAAFNRVKVSYTSALHDYQKVEAETWEDFASQAVLGVLPQDLDLAMVQWHGQARRLAKIAMHKGNPGWRLVLITKLAGLDALGERIVWVNLSELGISESFLVTRFEIAADGMTCGMHLTSLGASAYQWNPALEEGTAPPLPQNTAVPFEPEVPTGLALDLERVAAGNGTMITTIRASVDAPSQDVLQLQGQYKESAASDWLSMSSTDVATEVVSGIVEDGVTYDVQVRWVVPYGGTEGDWSATDTITVIADPTPPGLPTSVTASKSGSDVTISWVTPNSLNFYRVRVYRNSINDFSTATLFVAIGGAPFTAGSYVDAARPNGTWYYWVTAINPSGAETAAVATLPASITIP